MDKNIQSADKINILFRTGIKVVRGCFKRLFLKEAHGMLLVGKGVQISHGKHIRCGKNVKFEDYSEIHGLCSEGLNFGDYVTISRGVMIRPASYYGGDYGMGLTMGEHSSIGPMVMLDVLEESQLARMLCLGQNAVCSLKIMCSLIHRPVLKAKVFSKKVSPLKMIAGLEVM